MFASFRKIFKPTIDERIDFLKGIITLHKNAIGRYCTCTQQMESTMPGCVTD